MLDHPRGAIGALEAVAAVPHGSAAQIRSVEKQQRLFAGLELARLATMLCQPAAARRRVGVMSIARISAWCSGKRSVQRIRDERPISTCVCSDRRRRRGQDHAHLDWRASPRLVRGVILDALLLLEARLVGFVDDDQADLGLRGTALSARRRSLPPRPCDRPPRPAPLNERRPESSVGRSRTRLEALENGSVTRSRERTAPACLAASIRRSLHNFVLPVRSVEPHGSETGPMAATAGAARCSELS